MMVCGLLGCRVCLPVWMSSRPLCSRMCMFEGL